MRALEAKAVSYITRENPPPPDNVRKIRQRPPSEGDVDGWLDAADHREAELWLSIDALLRDLHALNPARVARIRKDVKWLRKEAAKKGLPWGRR